MAIKAGTRTALGVPLLREGNALGTILVRRTEVRPFEDKHIALLKTFADQAAIAIENARLLNELRQRTDDLTESLEQQTATSEVLKVISSSPGDLEPVFQAMLANATQYLRGQVRRCSSPMATSFRLAAITALPPGMSERSASVRSRRPARLSRRIATRSVVQIADMLAGVALLDRSPRVRCVTHRGFRTLLAVPMLKDDEADRRDRDLPA